MCVGGRAKRRLDGQAETRSRGLLSAISWDFDNSGLGRGWGVDGNDRTSALKALLVAARWLGRRKEGSEAQRPSRGWSISPKRWQGP